MTHEVGYTAAKRPSRTLAKLTANRVCILEFSFAWMLDRSILLFFFFFFFGGGGVFQILNLPLLTTTVPLDFCVCDTSCFTAYSAIWGCPEEQGQRRSIAIHKSGQGGRHRYSCAIWPDCRVLLSRPQCSTKIKSEQKNSTKSLQASDLSQ